MRHLSLCDQLSMRGRAAHVALAAALVGLSGVSARADGVPYQFSINQNASGTNGTVGFNALTTGTLKGNWDLTTNPGGTRTKPGLFGPFGPEDNDPVPLALGAGLGDAINTKASGAFDLTIDTQAGTLQMQGFGSNLLASGSAGLTAELSFQFDTFRAKSPDSLYIGGFPLNVPIGQAQFTKLQATQLGQGLGTLTSAGGNLYDFSLAMALELSGEVEFLGNPLAIPAVPLPVLLSGQIALDGTKATLAGSQLLEFANTTPIGQALPEFAFALPTILPPGGEANLLLNLMLDEIASELSLQFNLSATGQAVPAPGVAALVGVVGLLAASRRRRV